ncbi:hypothetical protein ACQ4PT_023111 [Festuca glaucescens]
MVKGVQVASATSSAFAITALTTNFVSAKISAKQKNVAWSKPVQGSYKMNVDASFFGDGSGAARVVLRNCRGEAVAGRACPLENVLNAAAAEALALLRGWRTGGHPEPSKLPYQLLKQITNDFDKERILGSGGFGTVTRGLKHPNIVELVGFCNEWEEELAMFEGKQVTAERLRIALCFEYVHNGSLNKFISDETTGLTWHTRFKIVKGICEGLKYLREGLEYPVMHFDLKPDNILLDECMVPKIADFGLSKLFGEENTKKTMSSAGTRGYCPPEYIKHQIISREFDIFSLGVIIVKIITGHEGYNSTFEMTTRKAVRLVHESWRKKLRETLSHTSLEVYCNQVKRCIEIALDCLKSNRQERPSIQDIVSRLNETETMIGDRDMQNEQFYQGDGEFTLPSKSMSIPINYGSTSENFLDVDPTAMSLGLLKEITDDFSTERLLGKGLCGSVYKGVYGDGKVIAVRKLYPSHRDDDEELQNEIKILMRIRHQNILQLVGYCCEKEELVVPFEGKLVVAVEIHNALCFEYLGGGSLEQYISPDTSSSLDWQTQYRIIKGICEGIRYLHEGMLFTVFHMNLKPSKILMNEQKMVPKIGGFGLARFVPLRPTVTTRYMPPEYIHYQFIKKESDIFSLGVIILELMTGRRTYDELHDGMQSPKEFVEMAHEKWRERLQKTVDFTSAYFEHIETAEVNLQQVETCLGIAMNCLEEDRHKRPTIEKIIKVLNETETGLTPLLEISPDREQLLDSEDSELLLKVHPLELCFLTAISSSSLEVPRNNKKKKAMTSSSCSLQLKNMGNDRVAFMLVADSPMRYLMKMPLCGIVPPRSAYTLALTLMPSKQRPSTDSNVDFFTLYSVAVGEYDLKDVDKDSMFIEYDSFFKKAKEMEGGDEVQERKLKAIGDRPSSSFSFVSAWFSSPKQPTRLTIETITTPDAQQVSSIDVHPTKPWIMTTNHLGILGVWDCHTMTELSSFELVTYVPVHVAKFVTQEKWIIVGDFSGRIHVYSYDKGEHIEVFHAHDSCITTLVVHPVYPFVLSSSSNDNHLIKLWDWHKGWECTRTYQGHTDRVTQVKFNPKDANSFFSASLDGMVKIWSICSNDSSNIMTLDGKVESLHCLAYFTRRDRPHLIAGCKDMTAQIWDLGITEGCVYELEGHTDSISVVSLHPDLPVLITGSLDGTVHIWDSTTYKLENIISFNLGAVYAMGRMKRSRRIVVGCHQGLATFEISLH